MSRAFVSLRKAFGAALLSAAAGMAAGTYGMHRQHQEETNRMLIEAAASGSPIVTKAIVCSGVTQAAKDKALFMAALRGHADAARILIVNGAGALQDARGNAASDEIRNMLTEEIKRRQDGAPMVWTPNVCPSA